MKLETAFKWLSEIQWMLGSDVLNACHCACCFSGIPVLSVGGCVLSVGIAFAVVEFAASGKGRVDGTTEY